MSELSNWLKAHGLAGLRDVLEAQQIDLDILPDLTEEDFKHLGIALGPRRRLLKSIQAISATPAPLSPSGAEQALAQRKPVLVVIEDVHWIDPSTLEFGPSDGAVAMLAVGLWPVLRSASVSARAWPK